MSLTGCCYSKVKEEFNHGDCITLATLSQRQGKPRTELFTCVLKVVNCISGTH